MKKRQRELIEKQRIERMNKDRENKWQNILPAKEESKVHLFLLFLLPDISLNMCKKHKNSTRLFLKSMKLKIYF